MRAVTNFDHAIRRWIKRHRTRPVTRAMRVVTRLGDPRVHIPVSLLAALLVALRATGQGALLRALPIVLAPPLSSAAHYSVKLFYHRQRPPGALRRGKTEASFPSGHSTASVAVWGTLAYVLSREGLIAPAAAAGILAAIALAVGTSRAYLDWHWASDVVGGWGAGLVVAALCGAGYEVARGGR